MSRILINESHSAFWFERLSVISYYNESEFEIRILKQASFLFKEYFVIPFKKQIKHLSAPSKVTKPDLAFIKRDYSQWMLVEVELDSHEDSHVLSQVDVMLNADFNSTEILTYIKSKAGFILEPADFNFDDKQLEDLVQTKKPEVLVIVDETKISWEQLLNGVGVKLCVVQVYKNGVGEEILRIKGQYPRIYTGSIHCREIKYPAQSIEVINHFELLEDYDQGNDIEIYYNDLLTKWKVVINKNNKCIFKCVGPINPLPTGKDFLLRLDEEKKFYYFTLN
jgi:hypothetical protein